MTCEAESRLLPEWEEQAESSCVVDYCKSLMDITRRESCGKCVLCREGTWQVYEILKNITEGYAHGEDLELVIELLELIRGNSGCEMSQEGAWRCIELIREKAEDWDQHIRRKRCTHLICQCSFTVFVDPALCDGCGLCREACKTGAIDGAPGLIHVIRTERCCKALSCMVSCPKGAIKKAGPIKPKVPQEPIPVGSLEEGAEDDEAGRRRRRRKS